MFSASTHTLWFSFVPQKVSVLFFKTQVMKGGTGLGRGAAIEKGSQRKELQDVPECVSPLSKYRQRQDGERAPDSRKMPSAIQSLPRQHGPRAQSARVHTHTHTHTLPWRTVLSHPRKDLLFQLNPSRSTPHVREERNNRNKTELLWLFPWGSTYIK